MYLVFNKVLLHKSYLNDFQARDEI